MDSTGQELLSCSLTHYESEHFIYPITLTTNTNKYWLPGSQWQLLKARKDVHLCNEKESKVSESVLKHTSKFPYHCL